MRCFSTKHLNQGTVDFTEKCHLPFQWNVRNPMLEMSFIDRMANAFHTQVLWQYQYFIFQKPIPWVQRQSLIYDLVCELCLLLLWIRAWALSLSLFSMLYLTFACIVSNYIQRLIQCSIQFNANGRVLLQNYYWNS